MLYEHADNGLTKNCGNCLHWDGKENHAIGTCVALPFVLHIIPTPEEYASYFTPRTFSCNNHVLALDKET